MSDTKSPARSDTLHITSQTFHWKLSTSDLRATKLGHTMLSIILWPRLFADTTEAIMTTRKREGGTEVLRGRFMSVHVDHHRVTVHLTDDKACDVWWQYLIFQIQYLDI